MRPALTPETILSQLRRLVGDVSELAKLPQGEESQAFRFERDGRSYVLRINLGAEGFEKDDFAHRHFARADLPIPKILSIDAIEQHFFCISEWLPGVTLQDTDVSQSSSLMEPVARVMTAIGETPLPGVSGFGPFDSTGRGQYGSWRDFILDSGKASQVLKFAGTLNELAEFCPEKRGLIHGDFGSNNVLIANGKVSGVLDWSEAMIGDPVYDASNILYWRDWLPCMACQADYLETVMAASVNVQMRLLCYQLRIGITEIQEALRQETTDGLSRALRRCDLLQIAAKAALRQAVTG